MGPRPAFPRSAGVVGGIFLLNGLEIGAVNEPLSRHGERVNLERIDALAETIRQEHGVRAALKWLWHAWWEKRKKERQNAGTDT